MDARKIQFLIGIQREIDKLEAKEGNTPKIEKVKSRFYDVVEVEEVVNTGNKTKQDADNQVNVLNIGIQEHTAESIKGLKRPGRLSAEERERNRAKLEQLKKDAELADIPLLNARRKNPNAAKKKINIINEDIVKKETNLHDEESETEPEKIYPHRPKDVAAFLVRFRERKNRGLKYLTHRWSDMKRDQPLTYEEVILNVKKELWECKEQYKIPDTLYYKVVEYAISKTGEETRNGYTNKHPHFFYSIVERIDVYSGWSSDEMIEWTRNNPGGDPNQDDYWKDKLIQPFKKAIEVRDGMFESYMKRNTEAVLKSQYQRFNPVYSDSLKDARFFTDVPTLFEGIRQLLETAKEHAKDPTLIFDYLTPESSDLFAVRQIKIITDKIPDINSTITKKKLISGGNFGMAYNNFYGLCNWSILCKRAGKFTQINLLTDIDDLPEIELIDKTEVEGFTHILTFYDL